MLVKYVVPFSNTSVLLVRYLLLPSSSVATCPDVCLTKCILYSKTACREGTVYTIDQLKASVTCHGVTLNGSAQKRPLVDACLH